MISRSLAFYESVSELTFLIKLHMFPSALKISVQFFSQKDISHYFLLSAPKFWKYIPPE